MVLRGGRILDPGSGIDAVGDLVLVGSRIAGVLANGGGGDPAVRRLAEGAPAISVSGLLVTPGFIDLHSHLREPGFEEKESIESGTRAGARGGFTTLCAMPNTSPTVDTRATVEYITRTAAARGAVRVLPIGTVSKGEEGQELTEMADLAEAGAVAFSDDGRPVASARLLRYALEYARMLDRPIVDHCEDASLSAGGLMHEGAVSARLGLKGNPAASEVIAVARGLALAELTGGRFHVGHLSTTGALDLVRRAKERGVPVTCEVTPHHLALTDEWVAGTVSDGRAYLRPPKGRRPFDPNTRVAPPLRTQDDVEALLDALAEGVVDAIATDHAPHTIVDKACEYGLAANGISGLETAAGVLLTLVNVGRVRLETVVALLTAGPARILAGDQGLEAKRLPAGLGSLRPGAPADVAVLDLRRQWVVEPQAFASRGRNTPLAGVPLVGRVVATIFGGDAVHWELETK
ncbi:MAG: dihydroorotase [Chloroflexi bacterium]|nr:dihydroorotase [Chloroflexota bacterium]